MMSVVTYIDSLENITSSNLRGFFVDWSRKPTSATLYDVLKGSDHHILAVNGEGTVIGFITAISDGILSAYIPFLEVLPEYQGRGIGKQLVQRMLAKLENVYMVDIVCDPELEKFYSSFGMRKLSGMALRNRKKLTGK